MGRHVWSKVRVRHDLAPDLEPGHVRTKPVELPTERLRFPPGLHYVPASDLVAFRMLSPEGAWAGDNVLIAPTQPEAASSPAAVEILRHTASRAALRRWLAAEKRPGIRTQIEDRLRSLGGDSTTRPDPDLLPDADEDWI